MKNITSIIGYIVLAVVLLQVVYSFTTFSLEPIWQLNAYGLRAVGSTIVGACGLFYLFAHYLSGRS
jgi:hypothetical protein